MLASLHGCFQAVHKGTALDGLIGEVLELVKEDLAMYNDKPLHSSNLLHIAYGQKCIHYVHASEPCQVQLIYI